MASRFEERSGARCLVGRIGESTGVRSSEIFAIGELEAVYINRRSAGPQRLESAMARSASREPISKRGMSSGTLFRNQRPALHDKPGNETV